MPLFATYIEARDYRIEQEKNGLSCTMKSSLEGFTVTCTFALSHQGIERPVAEPKPIIPIAQEAFNCT